ncbi:ATP-binding protein [bacterium]|nr:ATP-binding protein [bacterium]
MQNGRPECKHPEYVNFEFGSIGKSASTRANPNTAQYFYFWLAAGASTLELGNIVGAVTDDGHITFGTVVELSTVMDIENFLSDYISHDFGDPTVSPPSDLAEIMIAKVNVIRATHDRIRPIGRGSIFFATPEGVAWSLGMADYVEEDRGIPIGVMENGDGSLVPIFLDDEFLIGPEGSHMNMSGISGLATKTSLVEFLLKSILEKMIKTDKRKVAAVFFNVKGKDLLYLDKPNPQYEQNDAYTNKCRQMYDVLGIEMTPFENVRVFAPYERNSESHTKSFRRDGKVEHFIWDLNEIVEDIPYLFDKDSWDESVDAVYVDIKDQIERQPIRSYDQLIAWINEERRVVSQGHVTHWRGHEKEDFYKCAKNLDALSGLYDGLICTGGVDQVDVPLDDLYNGSIFVVDIQSLNDRGQAMVFSKILKRVYKALIEDNKDGHRDFDSVVFFIDELNKFAPEDPLTSAPIKQSVVEICARGRSIGVSLFGVEQFMSQIEPQVVDNSSTLIYGRTGPAELMTKNYSWLDVDMRNRLTTVPKGTFLLKHAKFTQPVFCKFPFPTCVPGDQYEEDLDAIKERDQVSAFAFRRDLDE